MKSNSPLSLFAIGITLAATTANADGVGKDDFGSGRKGVIFNCGLNPGTELKRVSGRTE